MGRRSTKRRRILAAFSPKKLYRAGEQGFWYDPSDLSSMFQDAAGTVAAALEQPVGLIRDKSGRGNHASQATTAAKPKLSARKNLLLATTTLATQSATLAAVPYTLSFKGTGSVALSGGHVATLAGTGADNRVSLTFTPTAGSTTFTVTGSVTDAQLEYESAVTTYQRVTTSTDYDAAGFPHYLASDGVDDKLATAAIDFAATDKMTVFAGLRAHVTGKTLVRLGNISTLAGSFDMGTHGDGLLIYYKASGSFGARRTAPILTKAIAGTAILDLAGTTHATENPDLRLNGVQGALTNYGDADSGTGSFGNHVVELFAGQGLWNGQMHQLVVCGAATDTAGISNGESFIAGRAGVTL